MNNMPRDNDNDSNKEKRGADSYHSPKKSMLRIRDVLSLVMVEEKEMLEIPNGPDKEIVQILQHWKEQDVHDQKINVGDVQILERMNGRWV